MTDDHAGAALLADPPTQELSPPINNRWPVDLLARIDAQASRLHLTRTAVMRLALAEGLPAVERLGR